MNCPLCHTDSLRPAKLEPDLSGYRCCSCKGFLLDLAAYRNWAGRHRQDENPQPIALAPAEDSKGALVCPKCSAIMMKYRISGEVDNRLDLCTACGQLWLDGGEWGLLQRLDLAASIPRLLSDSWQKRIRAEGLERSVEAKFEALFGSADYARIAEFRRWMRAHPQAKRIREYLNRPGGD